MDTDVRCAFTPSELPMADQVWLSLRVKNEITGEEITLYHEPANGEEVDRQLRYKVLDLGEPRDSPVKIIVRRMPMGWAPGAMSNDR